MNQQSRIEEELERRLVEIETSEAADPVHGVLGARTLTAFLAVVVGVAAVAWIGVLL